MMTELILPFVIGMLLGLFFFGGLWWTVRKAMTANNPALWFFGSSMLRIAVVMSGFYIVMAGDWRRLLIALSGFVIVRVLITRFSPPPQAGNHAP